jgi:hypothetical protein
MARHYYGINIGGGVDPSGVSTGTSTTNKDVEISTLDGAGLTKTQVAKLVETLENYLVENAPTP